MTNTVRGPLFIAGSFGDNAGTISQPCRVHGDVAANGVSNAGI